MPICPFCAVGCGLTAERAVPLPLFRGDPSHPVNHGAICARGAAATFEAGSRDRVLTPLRRAPGEASWSAVSWDEALARAGGALRESRRRTWDEGRRAAPGLAFYGGATAMNEEAYLFVRMARALGVLDLDHQGRSCHAATTAGLRATLGPPAATHDWADLPHARWILILGSNPSDAHPIAARWLHAARSAGAAVAVVDPRASRTARAADRHLAIRPGTDVALLCGLIGAVLARGAEDRAWLARHSDAGMAVDAAAEQVDGRFGGWDGAAYDSARWAYRGEVDLDHARSVLSATRRHFARYTPEAVAGLTGLAQADVEALAETVIARRRGAIVFSMGVTQQVSGVACVRAAAILQALLGNLDAPGGGLFPMKGHANIQGATDLGGLFAHLPGYLPAPTTDEPTRAAYGARWGAAPARLLQPLLDAWYEDGDYARLPRRRDGDHHSLHACLGRGEAEVMVLLGQNPVHGSGSPHGVARRLARLRTLICIDPFLNETSRFWERDPASATEVLVLPAAAFSEKPGSRTNACRRVQWQEACEAPRGQSRPDAWILDQLYRRAAVPGVRWPFSGDDVDDLYRAINDEIARACWLYEGQVRRPGGWHWPGGHPRLLEGRPRRVRLWAGPCEIEGWREDAVPDGPLPAWYAPPGAGDHPLHAAWPTHPLLAVRAAVDLPLLLSSAMTEADGRRCAPARGTRATLEVSVPRALAARLAVDEGARIWLETPGRRAGATARLVDVEDRGVVWAPSYWSGQADDDDLVVLPDPGDPHTLLDDLRLVPCRIVPRK